MKQLIVFFVSLVFSIAASANDIACTAEFRGFTEAGRHVVEEVKLREYYSDATTTILEGELRAKYFAATFYRDIAEVFGQIIEAADSSVGATGRSYVPAGRRFKLVSVDGSTVYTLECGVR